MYKNILQKINTFVYNKKENKKKIIK